MLKLNKYFCFEKRYNLFWTQIVFILYFILHNLYYQTYRTYNLVEPLKSIKTLNVKNKLWNDELEDNCHCQAQEYGHDIYVRLLK